MKVVLNGNQAELPSQSTISDLLKKLDRHPQRVAVEVNREIIKRDNYSSHTLQDGDEIEVLQFVGGGA